MQVLETFFGCLYAAQQPALYGDTSISDGLVLQMLAICFFSQIFHSHYVLIFAGNLHFLRAAR